MVEMFASRVYLFVLINSCSFHNNLAWVSCIVLGSPIQGPSSRDQLQLVPHVASKAVDLFKSFIKHFYNVLLRSEIKG